jgi:DNA replication protein DnaC
LREIIEENRIRDGVNLTDEDLKQNFIEESKKEGAYYYNQIKENEEKIEAEKRQREIEFYCRQSLITPKVVKGNFENVVLNSKTEEKYYKELLNYCKVFDEVKVDGIGILLTGNPGTGKSFYTSCIYNELKDKYKVYRFNNNR